MSFGKWSLVHMYFRLVTLSVKGNQFCHYTNYSHHPAS